MRPVVSGLVLLIFIAAGCASLTGQATPSVSSSPTVRVAYPAPQTATETLDPTAAAIVTRKSMGATSWASTATARPTPTATPTVPTIPQGSPPCTADDLAAVLSGTNGAMQALMAGITITNVGTSPCYLQLWPDVILLDEQGHRIDLLYGYYDYLAPNPPPERPLGMVGLLPGWSGGFSVMIWGVCAPAPPSQSVVLRLILMASLGHVDVRTPFVSPARCAPPGRPSEIVNHIGISRFYVDSPTATPAP